MFNLPSIHQYFEMDCDLVGFLDIVQNIFIQTSFFCSSTKPYFQNNLFYIITTMERGFASLHSLNNEIWLLWLCVRHMHIKALSLGSHFNSCEVMESYNQVSGDKFRWTTTWSQ